jgi:hypothetical protein
MIELSNVLQEVLKALGIDPSEAAGRRRAIDLGDHHRRPAAVETGGA